jgi:hypothetical protein
MRDSKQVWLSNQSLSSAPSHFQTDRLYRLMSHALKIRERLGAGQRAACYCFGEFSFGGINPRLRSISSIALSMA